MSIFAIALPSDRNIKKAGQSLGNGPLISELYDMAKGNFRLLFIYKKYEIAAELGDWDLMNKLYGEFKTAHVSLN